MDAIKHPHFKINIENASAIENLLRTVQKRCSARVLSVESIRETAHALENTLSGILFKKDWKGVSATINIHAQKFPSSYKGYPFATYITLYRGSSAWFITDISRDSCNQKVIAVNMSGKEAAAFRFSCHRVEGVFSSKLKKVSSSY